MFRRSSSPGGVYSGYTEYIPSATDGTVRQGAFSSERRLVFADSQVVSRDIGIDGTETRADIHIPAVTLVSAVHTFVVSVICCNLSPLSLVSVAVTCLRCNSSPLSLFPLSLVSVVTRLRCRYFLCHLCPL